MSILFFRFLRWPFNIWLQCVLVDNGISGVAGDNFTFMLNLGTI